MNGAASSRNQWGLAAGGAALILLALVALFRSPRETRPVERRTGPPQPAPVTLVVLGKDEASLTDPTPLFLPTEWNAGQNPLPAYAQRNPGSSFPGYPAKLQFPVTELALTFPADVVVPARAADVLMSGKLGETFLGRTAAEDTVAQLASRKAFVEVTIAGDGRRVLTQSLTDANPPGGVWQPMEFLVAVDAVGLVGPPILTESSRVAAVDGYFQNYLVKTLHAGERLAPGFYRICVGP